MKIGIDASRAFIKNKTGIEEYAYQVIKHLREPLRNEDIILYCNPAVNVDPDFELPASWRIKNLSAPILWTQARLSLEMFFHRPDVLFVPAHTVPAVHPEKTVVTIHGLEYEFCPGAYSFFGRLYMRWSIRKSCRWAKKIISVSENTKKDLMKLYGVEENKINVIHNGYSGAGFETSAQSRKSVGEKYFLFIGRLEERKNIIGIISAFEILKERHGLSHKLVLAGKFGYGEKDIKHKIGNSEYKKDIVLPGYVSDEEKSELLQNADVFFFPTFYEGFGLPILEAQNAGAPVVTSDVSSMPEVAGGSAVLVDPKNPRNIAEAAYRLISDEGYKDDIIKKGLENVKRFSWKKCAEEISILLRN